MRHKLNTLSRKRLIDNLVEAYVDWREACGRVHGAYGYWERQTGSIRELAFGAYVAALDAEERAAEVYAELVQRADGRPWPREPLPEPLGGRAWGDDWP